MKLNILNLCILTVSGGLILNISQSYGDAPTTKLASISQPELTKPAEQKGASIPETPTNIIPPKSADFAWIHANIIVPKCVRCHGEKRPSGHINLSSKKGVMRIVTPKNLKESLLYTTIKDGTMPMDDELKPEYIKLISDWISSGADSG